MKNRYLGKTGEHTYNAPIDFGVLTGTYITFDVATSGNVYAPVGNYEYSSGLIKSIYLELTSTSLEGYLWVFSGPIDPPAQNDFRNFTAEQLEKFIGIIDIYIPSIGGMGFVPPPSNVVVRNPVVSPLSVQLDLPYVLQPESKGLYFVFVQQVEYTYSAAAKVTGHFTLKRD